MWEMWKYGLKLMLRRGTDLETDLEFRAKIRAFERAWELEEVEFEGQAAREKKLAEYYYEILEHIGKEGETQNAIRDDYDVLSSDVARQNDIYLFLRSLKVAGKIQFPNEDMTHRRSFEQVLTSAIGSEHRIVACVGNGGERWGAAQIHFDKDWQSKIIPLLKSAVVIISMPSVTPSCLEESDLIRNTKELLTKTLFVLPPLCCYYQPRDTLGEDFGRMVAFQEFGRFQRRMVAFHRDVIGLHFPAPAFDEGCFVMMDFESGNVAKHRPWKIMKRTIRFQSGKTAMVDKMPTLDERDIRAAVNIVLEARGFI
jgi:hypothetical protein